MILYGILFLLIANASLSYSACCEEQIQIKFLLDTTSELIVKTKSSIPTCKLENASLSYSDCCEKETRAKFILDTMRGLISKAKSSIPTCSQKEECTKEPTKLSSQLDCSDLYLNGYNKSGIYSITPVNRTFSEKKLQVYCDMDTDGGGWTVIQRRGNFGSPDDYFYKDWKSYKEGFGSLEKDFWIGNNNIFYLTNQKAYSIRFDLENPKKTRTFAHYKSFRIDDEYNNFKLHIYGYSGNAEDRMMNHDGQPFSTKDKTQNSMMDGEYCAIKYKGAWWYKHCYSANLNGLYNEESVTGIQWGTTGTNRMVWTEMKIRPVNFRQASPTIDLNTLKKNSFRKSYLADFLVSRK